MLRESNKLLPRFVSPLHFLPPSAKNVAVASPGLAALWFSWTSIDGIRVVLCFLKKKKDTKGCNELCFSSFAQALLNVIGKRYLPTINVQGTSDFGTRTLLFFHASSD